MPRLTAHVPKDLNTIEPKLFFGFTKRQLIWNGIGVLAGGLAYFAVKDILNPTITMTVTMIFAFPFFLVSIFQKDGLTVEEIAKHFFISQYRKNPIRVYKESQQLSDIIIAARTDEANAANQKGKGRRKRIVKNKTGDS